MHEKSRRARISIVSLNLVFLLLAGCPGVNDAGPSDTSEPTDQSIDEVTCRCLLDAQVLVDVRFVTTDRTKIRSLGFDFDTVFDLNSGRATGAGFGPGPFTGDAVAYTAATDGSSPFVVDSLPSDDSAFSAITAMGGSILSDIDAFAFLNAAVDAGDAEVIAAPQVTTMHNQSAIIVMNNESVTLPELTDDFQTELNAIDPLINPVITGPVIEVTPRVAEDGTILLEFRPSTAGLFFTPNAAEWRVLMRGSERVTTVSVASGQTVVLGGIIDEQQVQTDGMAPLLNNVPIVSRLLDNRMFVTDETALLLLVTPEVVAVPDDEP